MATITLGETSVLATADNGNGNLLVAQPVALTQVATLQSLSFYVATIGGELVLGMYADASGKPGALQAQTAAFTPVAGWNTQPTLATPTLQPGNYWLAYLPQSNTLGFRKAVTGGTGYDKSFTFGAMPAVFPASPASTGSHWSLYATLSVVAPPPSPPSGNTVINGTVTDSLGASALWSVEVLQGTAPPPVSGLPSGVTLQAIDGETLTSPTTMSNNYYSRNGFTYATNNATYTTLNFDSPTFFQLPIYYPFYTADTSYWAGCGCNTALSCTSDTSVSTLLVPGGVTTAGIPEIGGGFGPGYGGSLDNPVGDWMVGLHVDEGSVSQGQGITVLANATQAGRFWDWCYTHACVDSGGNIDGNNMAHWLSAGVYTMPSGGARSVDQACLDIYWFAAQQSTASPSWGGLTYPIFQYPMGGSGTATADQMARGSNYGNIIDCFRSYANGTNTGNGDGAFGKSGAPSRIPLSSIVENNNGLVGSGEVSIQPYEQNWACWSTIIHGGRGIQTFVYLQNHGSGYTNPGSTGGTYQQAGITNALITQLAPVINSPFALGYVSAVSPHGYIFPVYEKNWLNGGIECCAHWYQGGNVTNAGLALFNGFYIFATTRNSESVTNVGVTFTINDPNATSVKVVYDSEGTETGNTISISGGQFTDSFAHAWTVRIYQVNG